MSAALVKEPLRQRLLVNALDGPPDARESDHIRGHVSHGNPGITCNVSETVPTSLRPKAFDHARIPPTLDVCPSEFSSRGSDIRRLHLGVIVHECRDITHQSPRTLSHEAREVVNKVGEDAIRHDGVLLGVGGTKIDGQTSRGHRNDERESGGEALEVEPHSIFRIHVPGVHAHRVIFWDEVVVDGICLDLRVNAELPLIKVESGNP